MDVTKLADEVFELVVGYVTRAVEPLLARLQTLEERPAPVIPEPMKGDKGDKGDQGDSVTVEDVEPIIAAAVDKWALDFERRAQDLLQRAVDRIPPPPAAKDGEDGEDGKDGLGFDDLMVEHDGKRCVTLKFQRGDIVKSFELTIPAVIDAGFWKPEMKFEPGDGVTHGGSYWIAQKSTDTQPEVGNDAWRLAVRKGRDARGGVPAPRDPGKPVKIGGNSE